MSKRTRDESESGTSRQRKKIKTETARRIAVQPSAGSSKTHVTESSVIGLPSHLDVEKFVESRAFEISSMHEAMVNTRESSSRRVWQTLPRHLRRRAASHNVRRVPARLRGKARAELDTVRKIALGRKVPRRGKAKRIPNAEKYLRRQRNKVWLETHIWHAKRMKMENLWGYRLALHTTEKSFRPSHRASVHGCILHDASYDALIQLDGPELTLKKILMWCCDPQGLGPASVSFSEGSRACNTHLYKPGTYPFDLIGPATVIWQPYNPSIANEYLKQPKKKNASKGKQVNEGRLDEDRSRRIWLRCHPSIFETVFEALQKATTHVLDDHNRTKTGETREWEVAITDFRRHFNIFDLIGPKSSQVIKGAFTPIEGENRDEFQHFWKSLSNIQSSGAIPRGMIIGLTVNDPRLNFPPKNAKWTNRRSQKLKLTPSSGLWPSPQLGKSEIWDEDLRQSLVKPRYKKKDIDSRKSKHLIPGSKLRPLRQDNRIPLLLVQQSIGCRSNLSSTNDDQALHGWSIILPRGWGMPFFSSLIYTGTRVGGQRERRTQWFEANYSDFPNDYPATAAHEKTYKTIQETEIAKWERKPPAKRPNWEKLGVERPWHLNWKAVLGFENSKDQDLVPTQRTGAENNLSTFPTDFKPWMLRGSDTRSILNEMIHCNDQATCLRKRLCGLRGSRVSWPEWNINDLSLLKTALLMISLDFPYRGSPQSFAFICQPTEEETSAFYENSQAIKAYLRRTEDNISEDAKAAIGANTEIVVGYVTTGHYSLSIGKSRAIGAISLSHFIHLMRIARRNGHSSPFVKVRNQHSTDFMLALATVLD